jgi:hypothetical protein
MTGTSLLRRGLPGLLAALALAAVPAAASADGISLGLSGCPAQTIEHPFARWLDKANYVLVPGGTFEGSLSGWKLSGGAKVVAGSESFAAHGAGEKYALSLPSGSSATPGGGVLTLPLGLNIGGKAWAPSLPTLITANLLGVLSGGKATVAFRFTPIGLGAKWRIDDVYVDPYARH